MLQLKNATPFSADIAVFPNEQGIDTLYTIVKATFSLGKSWTLVEEQLPPQAVDEHWGEPEDSSIKCPSDFHTGKSATDIIMLGDAFAPNQQPVRQLDVQLDVGQVSKTLRVIGDRVWNNGEISMPEPFTSMPIIYEKAFGGRHDFDDQQCIVDERNPLGCSFAGKRDLHEMDGLPLPNIEDPRHLIQNYDDNPMPAGFGAFSPSWLPRRQYSGSYDDAWQSGRAPYLPVDFDNRFLNAAHPDLIYPGFLKGGEPVYIKNMHPNGDIRVALPEVNILCKVNLDGKAYAPQMRIESLILDPNQLQLSLVWKAGFECDKKSLNISEIEVKLSR